MLAHKKYSFFKYFNLNDFGLKLTFINKMGLVERKHRECSVVHNLLLVCSRVCVFRLCERVFEFLEACNVLGSHGTSSSKRLPPSLSSLSQDISDKLNFKKICIYLPFIAPYISLFLSSPHRGRIEQTAPPMPDLSQTTAK